jgi:hypothetical protein
MGNLVHGRTRDGRVGDAADDPGRATADLNVPSAHIAAEFGLRHRCERQRDGGGRS